MKRALAERAKQSSATASSTGSSNSPPEQPPTKKLARLPDHHHHHHNLLHGASGGGAMTVSSSSPAARNSRIQQLTSAVVAADDGSDGGTATAGSSSFYLKHQNRALATELWSLQFAVTALEQEREYRRQQCFAASQALNSLQATWTQLETALSSFSSITTPTSNTAASCGSGGANDVYPKMIAPPGAVASTTSFVPDHIRNPDDGEDGEDAEMNDGDEPQQQQNKKKKKKKKKAPQMVEWTHALAEALATLGRQPQQSPLATPTPCNSVEQFYSDLSQLSANVAQRANVLQEWILNILQHQQQQQQQPRLSPTPPTSTSDPASSCEARLAQAMAHSRWLETQVEELSRSLDAAVHRERKIRRHVYRFAAGMVTKDHVIHLLDATKLLDHKNNQEEGIANLQRNDDGSQVDDIAVQVQREVAEQQQLQQKQLIQQQASEAMATVKHEEPTQALLRSASSSSSGDQKPCLADVAKLESKVKELEEQISNRDASLQEMSSQLKAKELEINQLALKQQSEEDVEKMQRLEMTLLQLEHKEQRLTELETQLTWTKQQWSQTLGNEKAALESVDEQLKKFEKRWSEISSAMLPTDESSGEGNHYGNNTSVDVEMDTDKNNKDPESPASLALGQLVAQAKQITQLQHKLSQALENVRQAESSRMALAEALDLNQSLQSRLDEMKSKYTALQASSSSGGGGGGSNSKGSTGNSSASIPLSSSKREPVEKDEASSTGGGNHTPREKETHSGGGGGGGSSERGSERTEGSSKYDKMHRDFRRTRKELAAMTASREAAKSKLEKSEKEREQLLMTNARLLKQTTEKDEMNAKSLATILHLKDLIEQLTAEKETLEQQVKTASQLALAARLASNAKSRVSEEVLKEKQELIERLEACEKRNAETKEQLDQVMREFSEGSGKMTTLKATLANSIKRSDELVTENEVKAEKIRNLNDALNKVERERQEAKDMLEKVLKNSATGGGGGAGGGGGDVRMGASNFSVEQLNTQISVLKSRLACPVCHYRDKECIITRCRHMHCKQCVEEQISNRSRKCPTCNNKFSEKDVEDVWL